jgi:hypothetical protein
VSKTVAVVLALLSVTLFPTKSKAQLLPTGNVYAGVGYADSVDVINRYSFHGWNASAEALPFHRFTNLGLVLDGSGYYCTGIACKGVKQYNAFFGPRLSFTMGKWRPFVHLMAGVQRTTGGSARWPLAEDLGGGIDRKLPFKNFSWRLQADYMHLHFLSFTQNDVRASTGVVWRF